MCSKLAALLGIISPGCKVEWCCLIPTGAAKNYKLFIYYPWGSQISGEIQQNLVTFLQRCVYHCSLARLPLIIRSHSIHCSRGLCACKLGRLRYTADINLLSFFSPMKVIYRL